VPAGATTPYWIQYAPQSPIIPSNSNFSPHINQITQFITSKTLQAPYTTGKFIFYFAPCQFGFAYILARVAGEAKLRGSTYSVYII